jgi:hypothetical protein
MEVSRQRARLRIIIRRRRYREAFRGRDRGLMLHLPNGVNKQGIELAGFKYHDGGLDNPMYEVSFPNQGQADLFDTAFNKSTVDYKH